MDMNQRWEEHPEDAAAEARRRHVQPPKDPGVTVEALFDRPKPTCTEDDCDGIVIITRHDKTLRLADYAHCLLCGRRYAVEGLDDFREGEGFAAGVR